MTRAVFMFCRDLEDNHPRKAQIEELMMVAMDDMSPREQDVMDKAMNDGDIYWANISKNVDGSFDVTTDLGSPDSNILVRFPKHVPHTTALKALQKLVNEVMM